MAKAKTKQVFKQYSPYPNLLLPTNLDELIDNQNLVHILNGVVDQMDLTVKLDEYVGGAPAPIIPGL